MIPANRSEPTHCSKHFPATPDIVLVLTPGAGAGPGQSGLSRGGREAPPTSLWSSPVSPTPRFELATADGVGLAFDNVSAPGWARQPI